MRQQQATCARSRDLDAPSFPIWNLRPRHDSMTPPPSVLGPTLTRNQRANELLSEMQACEGRISAVDVGHEEALHLGEQIATLGRAVEELLTGRAEIVGRGLLKEVQRLVPGKNPTEKAFLLQMLRGTRHARVLAHEALTSGAEELWALGADQIKTSRDSYGLKALLATVRDKKASRSRRIGAIEALGAGNERNLDLALAAVLSDPDPHIREAVVRRLEKFVGGPCGRTLISYVGDPDDSVREAVSYVVAQAGGETTNRLLFPLCHSPLPYVRTAAIRALNIEKDPDAKAAIVKALSDRSRAVQIEAAAKLLSSSDSTWGEQVIAAIPNKLKTREILQVVSRMSNCQSIPAASFLAWAASCPDFELRMQATDQIGRFPSHIGLAALAEQLKHEIWIGQEAILGALASGRRCEPGIVDVALLESRKSLDPTMEELWIAAAAGTANEDLRRQLQRTLTQSDNLGTEILGALGVPVNDHEEMLFAAQLASDSRTTRSAAAIGLVRSGSTSARSHLHSRDFILDLTMLMESATYEIGMGNPAAGEQLVGLLERQIALESRRGSVQLQSLKAEALGRFLRTVGALD